MYRNSESIDNLLEIFFLSRYQNLFLNIQKFEKFEKEKTFPEIMLFLLLFRLTLDCFKNT